MVSLSETARTNAKTFLAIGTDVSARSTSDILRDYWAAKSGLTPVAKYSIMDHMRTAGGTHYLRSVV